jgi:pyridoxal phosphate enzyme (YggS family)
VTSPTGPSAVWLATVAERVADVRRRIDARAGGRVVRLVAVTKGFGVDHVEAAVAAGVTSIGENYAQELVAKAGAGAGGDAVRWHFIGGIQRNKIATLAPFVAVWETIDRPAVAEAVARHSPGVTSFVQINLTDDPGRPGCSFADADDVVAAARRAGLEVRGVMGVGPVGPPERSRQPFAALAALARRLGLPDVSMGMSDDFEIAVEEGSTMVRLGTALFGPRSRSEELRR